MLKRVAAILPRLVSVVTIFMVQASGATSFEFSEETLPLNLGPKLSVFSLKGQVVSFDEVLSSWGHRFEPTTQNVPNFGFNQSAWGRLSITNSSDRVEVAYVEHHYIHTDEVILFQKNDNGVFESLVLGDNQHSSNQWRPHLYPVFPITLRPGENLYYIRSTSRESTSLPLILKNLEQINQSKQTLWVLSCLVLIMLSMVFLFYLYFKYREIHFIYYGLFCFGFVLNHVAIEGLLGLYFPQSDWSYIMNEGHFLFAIFYQIFLTLGAMSFLGWNLFRTPLRYLPICALVSSGVLFGSFFILDYVDLVIPYFLNAFFVLVVFIVSLIIQSVRGNKHAIFYILTWTHGIGVFFSYIYNYTSGNYSHSIGFLISTTIHIVLVCFWFQRLATKKTIY